MTRSIVSALALMLAFATAAQAGPPIFGALRAREAQPGPAPFPPGPGPVPPPAAAATAAQPGGGLSPAQLAFLLNQGGGNIGQISPAEGVFLNRQINARGGDIQTAALVRLLLDYRQNGG